MAPEQLLDGEAGAVTDIWSLAALLSEMISGRRAFPGDDGEAVREAVLGSPPSAPTEVRTGVGEELARFCASAFDKDPRSRLCDIVQARTALRSMTELLTPATEMPETGSIPGEEGRPPETSDAPQFHPPVRPGFVVANYDVLERIGSGGMGLVFRGRDRRLGRSVALKFLPPQLIGDLERQRFVLEAKAASALDHPNICTIYGIDETSTGETFIAMAYYDGSSLADRLAVGRLPAAEAVAIAEQVASGLAAAHERGIVHCDIKPGNIMLTSSGVVKIVDFGISRIAAAPSSPTESASATAGYAAPEQLRREELDHRVDIWALGVVLYEMLAGQRPFGGKGLKALVATVENDPEPLERLVPDLPSRLGRIVRRAMAKDPAERYRKVDDLLADLHSVSSPGPSSGATDQRRARPAVPWLVAAGAVFVIALAGWVVTERGVRGPPGRLSAGTRVVMLGFHDLGGGGRTAWLAASLEELLKLELSAYEGLEISTLSRRERSSMLGGEAPGPGRDPDSLTQLGDSVEADYSLGGSYRVSGDAMTTASPRSRCRSKCRRWARRRSHPCCLPVVG